MSGQGTNQDEAYCQVHRVAGSELYYYALDCPGFLVLQKDYVAKPLAILEAKKWARRYGYTFRLKPDDA